MVQAKDADEGLGMRAFWYGNFFPDMRAWNKLDANERRGAGGKSVFMQFPNSELTAHMSVFAPKTYKKAHRHGPGRAIIIPAGEGYSIMWEEGKEKIVCPWHECSMITPPDKWFHQHFNAGGDMARYLALHPPMQFHGHAEKVEDRAKDQIEYPRRRSFYPTASSKRNWPNGASRARCRPNAILEPGIRVVESDGQTITLTARIS